VIDGALQRGLVEAAAALPGRRAAEAAAPLLYGPLLDALAPRGDDWSLAMELIYEGYLLHYRNGGRLLAPASRETTLLAGDFFYARGLRLVAARHDVAAVDLLARLMASCSSLRALEAPFSHDDDLWVVTVAGLGALRGGASVAPVHSFFDDLGRLSAGEPAGLPEGARAAAQALRLTDARPLAGFFAGETIGPHVWQAAGRAGAA
jgi:hypothetical protein